MQPAQQTRHLYGLDTIGAEDAVIVVGMSGQISEMNQAAESLIRCHASRAVGMQADEVLTVLADPSDAGSIVSLETSSWSSGITLINPGAELVGYDGAVLCDREHNACTRPRRSRHLFGFGLEGKFITTIRVSRK